MEQRAVQTLERKKIEKSEMTEDEKQRKEWNGEIYEVSNTEERKKKNESRLWEKIDNMQSLLTFSVST